MGKEYEWRFFPLKFEPHETVEMAKTAETFAELFKFWRALKAGKKRDKDMIMELLQREGTRNKDFLWTLDIQLSASFKKWTTAFLS